jgi:hypothetical protein
VLWRAGRATRTSDAETNLVARTGLEWGTLNERPAEETEWETSTDPGTCSYAEAKTESRAVRKIRRERTTVACSNKDQTGIP